MSWEEDMWYDAYDFEDFALDFKWRWEITWHRLNSKGYIWQDKMGKDYKPDDISDSYLLNILKFCERVWRPQDQVEALKRLASQRGLKCI